MPMTDGKRAAVATVAAFLVFAERDSPKMMFGSYTATEAVEAFAWLMGCKPDDLRSIDSPKSDPEEKAP